MINDFVLLSFHSIPFYPILYQDLCIRIRRLIRLPGFFYRWLNCLSSCFYSIAIIMVPIPTIPHLLLPLLLLIRSLSLLNDTKSAAKGLSLPHTSIYIISSLFPYSNKAELSIWIKCQLKAHNSAPKTPPGIVACEGVQRILYCQFDKLIISICQFNCQTLSSEPSDLCDYSFKWESHFESR